MSLDGAMRAACEARAATATGYPAAAHRATVNGAYKPVVGTRYVLTDLRRVYTVPLTKPASGAVMESRFLFLVDLFFPLGSGESAGDTLAQAVVDVFPYGLTLSSGGVDGTVFRATRAGGLKGDSWYQVPVTITVDVRHLNNL